MNKVERVTELSIIKEMIDSKPYYSSYSLKTVLEFIDEYFENCLK